MTGDALDLAVQRGGGASMRRHGDRIHLGVVPGQTVLDLDADEADQVATALHRAAAAARGVEPMTPAMLQRSVARIPGDEGWWASSGGMTYQRLAATLVARGLTGVEVLDVLETAYAAAAGEFGS
jgi:hypothetical protein